MGRRNSIVEETERKHVIETNRLKKERDQLLVKLSSETEIDAKEMRAVARENAQLKQKISSLQTEMDTYREQGDERLVEVLQILTTIARGAGRIMDYGFPGFEIHQIHNPWI